jgi:hypothetical protein
MVINPHAVMKTRARQISSSGHLLKRRRVPGHVYLNIRLRSVPYCRLPNLLRDDDAGMHATGRHTLLVQRSKIAKVDSQLDLDMAVQVDVKEKLLRAV